MLIKGEVLDSKKSLLAKAIYILAFTLLLAILAQIRIPLPFTPVPLTLQTLGILFIGYYLGARAGVASVLIYLTLGAMGLPFFSGLKGGVFILSGPTGGYLLGFLAGAYLIGKAKEMGWLSNWFYGLSLGLMAHFVIYLFGVTWFLAGFNDQAFFAATKNILMLTVIPFLPVDLLKSAIFGVFILSQKKARG
ncbi:MAG: biotin transporter BioY [Caldimicrobium sp.]|nr:biotin transporter BioY [Caldimicrobium sp.]MCX7613270.1 biotin transporter BioY [Caldimicrobium sp.]MDW8182047.1 biotin transporter BioY [Caldimicrobium sp.]